MTREEAIRELENIRDNFNYSLCPNEIFDMAIKALEQEPCEDCISRKQALIEIKAIMRGEPMLLKSLHRKKWEEETAQYRECMEIIKALPSVQPKPKTGHWIEKDGLDGDTYYDCSECGESWTTIEGTPWNNGMKYCPNCGAKMESEDKE